MPQGPPEGILSRRWVPQAKPEKLLAIFFKSGGYGRLTHHRKTKDNNITTEGGRRERVFPLGIEQRAKKKEIKWIRGKGKRGGKG